MTVTTHLVGTADEAIARSAEMLQAACRTDSAGERYAAAHRAAVHAAAALLAARAHRAGGPPRSVWQLLASRAPELAEWAEFLTAAAQRRRATERGAVIVSPREADDLLRQVEMFCEEVRARVSLPPGSGLPAYLPICRP